MADVTVNIVMNPGWEKQIFKLPPVKGAVTKRANEISARANSMGAGFLTKKVSINGEEVGGKQPNYKALKARLFNDKPVALVVTGNYSAMKDNHLHNTLLKSL